MVIRRKKTEKEKIRNKRVRGSGRKADVKFPSNGATKCLIVCQGCLLGCPKCIGVWVVVLGKGCFVRLS